MAAEIEPYRPLSKLALAGFAAACLWLLVLLVSALTAWVTATPMPLGAWMLLLPLPGLGLGIAGWYQSQRPEANLAGARLAACAFFLCLTSGLSYGAYIAATYAAIVPQSRASALEWLELLRDGKTDRAFRLTLPPDVRPRDTLSDAELASTLQSRFNQPGGRYSRGEYSAFRENRLVRIILQGGANTELTPVGLGSLNHTGPGYQVVQYFRIATPQGLWKVRVTLRSNDADHSSSAGRQWYVLWDRTELTQAERDNP